ncbi:MAG: DUF1015 domain-containing protein [Candidatus Goldbacteria bacterium]|nr:DUF1015 domain-containing protein [Candidatus Goldiibacteriota bacterium]
MAEVKPFSSVHYNSEKVDMAKVIMPPYDIIRDTSVYYSMSPYNVVRIDKGNEESGDNDSQNKYTRAAANLKKWISEGVLIRDKEECYYLYTQEYLTPDGTKREMAAFFGQVKLEEFEKKVVLPHEKTHSGPKVDRLLLMRQTKANTSPILSLYFDAEKKVDEIIRKHIGDDKPYYDVKAADGIRYRIYRVTDKNEKEKISSFFAGKKLFIADGHHRYETGINFRNEMREKGAKPGAAYDYIMMCLISMEHSGISILPTHRIKAKFNPDILGAAELEKFFEVKKCADEKELREIMVNSAGKKIIGIFGKGMCHALTLKKKEYAKIVNLSEHIMDYYLLDASVLHKLLFERILKMDETAINEGIDYTPDIDEAIKMVSSGGSEITFLLGPATVEEVRIISENGEVMPQKSTYFLPKLATGFLINSMEE